MIQHKDQRVGVFVDVQNMYYSARYLYGKHVNFGKVLEAAIAGRRLIRAMAYVIQTQTQEEQPFFDALSKQGFEVRSKDLQIFSGGQKKGDWDVGLAVDTIRMASKLDVVVIVSGDGDYLPLVDFLQNHGLLVEAVAFGGSSSMKLKERVDQFTDLSEEPDKYLISPKGKTRLPWVEQSLPRGNGNNGHEGKHQGHEHRPQQKQGGRRLNIPFIRNRNGGK
ncbi:MAG: NYN domain-containing protein [Candidatus Nomurabacteria bacterium]|nr:MAG: NYN domain-containing protein [Candidatus Nomurabacteria bacterium]